MSNVKLAGNVSGTGSVTIASPNTNSDISISLPTVTGGSFIVSDSSGNVGIGTSSPGYKLDARLSGTSSGAVIQVGNTGSGGFGGLGVSDGGVYPVQMWGAALSFLTGSSIYGSATEKMRIDSSGNVGIGTSSPLSVAGYTTVNVFNATSGAIYRALSPDTGADGRLQVVNGAVNVGSYSNVPFLLNVNGTERARIDSSGNVGIGGSSGGNRLYVQRTAGADFKGETYLTDGSQWIIQNSNTSAGSYSGAVQANDASIIYSSGTTNNGAFTIAQWSSSQRGIRIDATGNFQFNSGYGSVATAYGCRAWVNFNGTGTVAIRASGNVSSITDNGTGDYTVNFTTAMPDANYAVMSGPADWTTFGPSISTPPVAASVRLYARRPDDASTLDRDLNYVAIFR